ncbi:MAG TPA: HAD-IB family hydrolase, partial [Azonexus sp.]|nr:HAD-IB family hydrolase [Azonexus sp.]
QGGKITRVESWLESLGLWWGAFDNSYFYSDSHNDLPLMQKVKTPIAVDPDDKLRAHAGAQGWTVMSLR